MHDPQTLAFEIYLGRKKKSNGRYRTPFICVWHVDPEKGTIGTRRDDSCGWFSPPYSESDKMVIEKIIKSQYSQLFAKKDAYEKEQSFAYICYNQDIFGAIYWLWRAMKNEFKPKVAWQYGTALSNKEFQHIYQLAYNPVDNFQWHMKGIMESGEKGERNFSEFVFLVYRSFRSYYRPWYKHPRWHIHHWKIRFPIFRDFYRYWFQKCSKCKKRGFRGKSAYSNWDGDKIWCEDCNASVASSPIKK